MTNAVFFWTYLTSVSLHSGLARRPPADYYALLQRLVNQLFWERLGCFEEVIFILMSDFDRDSDNEVSFTLKASGYQYEPDYTTTATTAVAEGNRTGRKRERKTGRETNY